MFLWSARKLMKRLHLAAYLAGIAVGFWKDRTEIANQWNLDKRFEPELEEEKRNELYKGWQKAVKATMAFK